MNDTHFLSGIGMASTGTELRILHKSNTAFSKLSVMLESSSQCRCSSIHKWSLTPHLSSNIPSTPLVTVDGTSRHALSGSISSSTVASTMLSKSVLTKTWSSSTRLVCAFHPLAPSSGYSVNHGEAECTVHGFHCTHTLLWKGHNRQRATDVTSTITMPMA